MRFIVVADSHIRFPDDDVATYPSNALMLDRNRRVVEMINTLDAEFVVHLGDIVHPLPIEPGHVPAVDLASEVYADLKLPVHYVPGNHDIGDKPDAMVAVPPVADENYGVFEENWGAPFYSFDAGDLHFVVLDTPVLNSGLERERAQADWLEGDLRRAAGRRIFLFTHYPPFVRSAGEDEHYDNLGEPARTWLLNLVRDYKVEAVFSGHVHNFLYNSRKGTEFYVLPATGFVRPDYAELAAIAPESEWGRDDPPKLGFFIVDVDAGGHIVRPIRTNGAVDTGATVPRAVAAAADAAWQSPVGVTLRHGWMTETDFPTAGLDEFRRKTIRNDAVVLALWEARIANLRVPIGDLSKKASRARVRHLSERGMRFVVRSAGVPSERAIARMNKAADAVECWEIALWPAQYRDALERCGELPLRLAVAQVAPIGEGAVHHFVTSGFSPYDENAVATLVSHDRHNRVTDLVFRAAPSDDLEEVLGRSRDLADKYGRSATLVAELPRAGEGVRFDDDGALADHVAAVATVARVSPEVSVYLDGFMDHDRSYYPHNGLIDRRFNPRGAFGRLIDVASGPDSSLGT